MKTVTEPELALPSAVRLARFTTPTPMTTDLR